MSAAIRVHQLDAVLPQRSGTRPPRSPRTAAAPRRPNSPRATRRDAAVRKASTPKYATVSLRQAIQDMFAQAMTLPAYEGDGFIRAPAGAAVQADTGDGSPLIPAAGRLLRRLWSGVVDAVARFFDWLDDRARKAQMQAVEAYLARSTDNADLERRMRNLEYGNERITFG